MCYREHMNVSTTEDEDALQDDRIRGDFSFWYVYSLPFTLNSVTRITSAYSYACRAEGSRLTILGQYAAYSGQYPTAISATANSFYLNPIPTSKVTQGINSNTADSSHQSQALNETNLGMTQSSSYKSVGVLECVIRPDSPLASLMGVILRISRSIGKLSSFSCNCFTIVAVYASSLLVHS
jgi:hypothetical protein